MPPAPTQSHPRGAAGGALEASFALAKQRGKRLLLHRRADDTAGSFVYTIRRKYYVRGVRVPYTPRLRAAAAPLFHPVVQCSTVKFTTRVKRGGI